MRSYQNAIPFPDAFGNPTMLVPGQVYVFDGDVLFSVADATVLFKLPKGATLLDSWLKVWTAFDGDGTDLLEIGTTEDPDGIATAAVVSAAAIVRAGSSGYNGAQMLTGDPLDADTNVIVSYDHGGSAAAEGLATVFVMFKYLG